MNAKLLKKLTILLVAAGMILSACASATPTPAPAATTSPATEAPEPPKEEVKLTVWWGSTSPGMVAAAEQVMDLYMQEHPEVTIDLSFYSYEDYSNAMPAALAAGNPPDFSFGDPTAPNLPNYVAAGQVDDLTEIVKERGWDQKLQPGVIEFFNPLYGDKTYGIPINMEIRGFFYNKQILEEVGAEVPKTLDELEAVLEQVKAKGYTPLGMGNADKWGADYYWESLMLLYLADEDYQSFLRGTMTKQTGIAWGGEAVREGMEKFMEWVEKGYFNEDYASINSSDVHAQFAQGNMFAFVNGSSQNASLIEDKPDFEVGFFNWPRVYPDKPLLTMSDPHWLLILPKDSKNKEESLAVMDYILSPEVGKILAENGLIPLHKIDLGDVEIPAEFMQEEIVAVADNTMMGWLNYMAPYEFPDRQGSELQKLLAGETTLDEYMQFMQEAYDQAIENQ